MMPGYLFRFVSLILPILVLSACAQSVSIPYTDALYCPRYGGNGWFTRSTRAPAPAAATATVGRLTVQLGLAEGKWRAAGITHYRIKVERFCYCGNTGPFVIEVRDRGVVDAPPICANTQSGNCFEAGQDAMPYTVSGLFAVVQTQLQDPCRSVDATFDPTYGYPSRINAAATVDTTDIGFNLTVMALMPLT